MVTACLFLTFPSWVFLSDFQTWELSWIFLINCLLLLLARVQLWLLEIEEMTTRRKGKW